MRPRHPTSAELHLKRENDGLRTIICCLRRELETKQNYADKLEFQLHQSLQQGFAAGEMGFRVSLHGGYLGPPMSALGQKQTLRRVLVMSALPPKADIG
jgi:hypothetical protein